jgi:flagellar P-ring protein FlgI
MRYLLIILLLARIAAADRIKDLAQVEGIRDNHITGFGLVVGLDGSGDDVRSPIVKTAMVKMLKRLGLTIDPTDLKAKNVAAVMITADLPAFGQPGQLVDVTVSSAGNATSLGGGTLLAAPLRAPTAARGRSRKAPSRSVASRPAARVARRRRRTTRSRV